MISNRPSPPPHNRALVRSAASRPYPDIRAKARTTNHLFVATARTAHPASRGTRHAPHRCLLLLAALLLGCSADNGDGAALEPLPPQAPKPQARPRNPQSKNPLAFTAPTLDGWTFNFPERNARRRIVVYLFDPSAPASKTTTHVAARLHAERLQHNLDVVGVAVPPGYNPLSARRIPPKRLDAAELARLARAHLHASLPDSAAAFPCVTDPDAKIVETYTLAWGTSRLDQLPAFYPFAIAAADSERPTFPRHAEQSPDPADYLYRRILRRLGLDAPSDVDPLLGDYPPAPPFSLTDTTGKTHSLADYKGSVLVLTLFARNCPLCKHLLAYLASAYAELGPPARKQPPALHVLAVCTDTTGDALRALAAERRHPFPTAADPDWTLRSALRYRGSVPDTFVIGPDARIRFRHRDFTPATPALLQMEITTLLGLPTKPLLEHGLFSGDAACRICHPAQYADWTLTRHACAWQTLVRLGKENDPNCVRCHVVGHAQPGGFTSPTRTPHLTAVQCEACHGQNGCKAFLTPQPSTPATQHLTPSSKIRPLDCTLCHDDVHSPRFDFPSYRARVLHDQRAELLKLPRAEREQRLRRLCAGDRDQLFDPNTPYIGPAACGKCHPTEYNALKDGFHAKALDSLKKPAPDNWAVPPHKRAVLGISNPQCLRCHTTGFARPGGFPPDQPAPPSTLSPMSGVTCEACHGPGQAHALDPKKPRTILRFSNTCPECTVLPTCRQCHDDANHPDFDFPSVLPKARHPIGKALPPAK